MSIIHRFKVPYLTDKLFRIYHDREVNTVYIRESQPFFSGKPNAYFLYNFSHLRNCPGVTKFLIMTKFRPCIDIHQGVVKQIIGSTLSKSNKAEVNFSSLQSSSWYARLYKKDRLKGGHIIMLGPGNEKSALKAIKEFPGGMQLGGGITIENAPYYLEHGASKVIITSWVIPKSKINMHRLKALSKKIGRQKLVLDLSCQKKGNAWFIAKDKWQTITQEKITHELMVSLEKYCSEFLIHAADVEGKCQGIDQELVQLLGEITQIPTTYAGGAREIGDLETVKQLSNGKIDLTIGSALDIFGGSLIKYQDCVAFNSKN